MKKMMSKVLVRIMRISPRMGNFMMDILGYDRYLKVLKLAR